MQAATVSIDETFSVDSPPDIAWTLLTDPSVVVRCMPGAEIVEERDDGTLLGALTVKLGPTTVAFKGELTPTFDEAGHHGSLVAQGADGQGRTRARATTNFAVTVRDDVDGGAQVTLTGQVEVSGPLAPFVRTGGTHLTKRMVGDFSSNLSSYIEANAHADGAAGNPANGSTAPASAVRPAAPISGFKLVGATLLDVLRAAWDKVLTLARRWLRRKDRP
jgi:carbon monoxide dehydrogenase subunit G